MNVKFKILNILDPHFKMVGNKKKVLPKYLVYKDLQNENLTYVYIKKFVGTLLPFFVFLCSLGTSKLKKKYVISQFFTWILL